nr:putative ribonuclease H-like domain-containing protein [Tanacetum cinerariifolium]
MEELEDLEVLWQLVKERFASLNPKNFSDDFLLTTLTYMFEKPDVQAQVWKNQRSVHGLAKVKSWRLLESCRVHIITFITTQMILVVERRYPLTSTNDQVSAVASVSAASTKILVSALPNVDTLSNAVIYSYFSSQSNSLQLDNDDLKQINADDLEEMDLKWQMAMLTVRAKRFLQRTGRNLRENGPTSLGFDMSKVECYNFHRKGHFARECRSPKDIRRNVAAELQRRNVLVETSTSNALVSQCVGVGSYDWSFQIEEEPTNYALMAFTSSSSSSSDNEAVSCSKACTKAYATLQSHYDKLTYDFRKSQFDVISYKTRLESVEARLLTDDSLPASPKYVRYHSGDRYHAVPSPYTGTFMPSKPDLVFHDAPNVSNSEEYSEVESPQNTPSFVQTTKQVKPPRSSVKTVETSILAANHKIAISKPKSNGNSRNRKACFVCKSLTYLIKDCDYYDQQVAQTPTRNHEQRGSSQQYARMTLPNPQRHVAKTVVTNPHSPPRMNINRTSSPKASTFTPEVTAAEAPMVNAVKGNWGNLQHALKDKGVIDSGCSRHMIGNMSYLSNFEELNGGMLPLVVIQRVVRSLMCDKKNNVLFTDTKCLVLSPEFKLLDENQVLLRVPRENNMYNDLNQFCGMKGIKREFSVPRIPQQNGIAKRKNKTLIEAARTMLVDLLLPIPFSAKNPNCTRDIAYKFSKNKPNVTGSGPTWLFDIDTLTKTINYQPVTAGNQSNHSVGVQEQFDAEKAEEDNVQQYVLFPVWSFGFKNPHNTNDDAAFRGKEPEFERRKPESEVHVSLRSSPILKTFITSIENQLSLKGIKREFSVPQTFQQNGIAERKNRTLIEAARTMLVDLLLPIPFSAKNTNDDATFGGKEPKFEGRKPNFEVYVSPSSKLEHITYSNNEEDVGAEADFTNLETTIIVSPIPTTRVHKDHFVTQIIGDLSSATQTKSMTRVAKDQGGHSQINNDDFHTSMQEELLQFKMQKVWVLVDLPHGKKAIGTKWVFRNKKDERGIVVRNKARLVAQGDTQEEGIDYGEVFAPFARIEAIRLFLAYASFMGFMVYQMNVKSAFMYETIKEEVYICQPLGFEDPDYPNKVYKVVKALYGLHQAPRARYVVPTGLVCSHSCCCVSAGKYSFCCQWKTRLSGSTRDERIGHQMADGYAFTKDQQVLKEGMQEN